MLVPLQRSENEERIWLEVGPGVLVLLAGGLIRSPDVIVQSAQGRIRGPKTSGGKTAATNLRWAQ